MPYKITVIVGSLRKASLNLKMAKALSKMAADSLQLQIIDIGSLPLYNEDLDVNPPAQWQTFRQQVSECQGLLFITPEYNRSVPGVLKNAIDVGSRPYGKSVWDSKPGAIISVSPGNMGGFGANHHLRQSLVFLNVPTLQQPEAYIGGAAKLFDEEGNITNDSTASFLHKFIEAYTSWVAKHVKHKPS